MTINYLVNFPSFVLFCLGYFQLLCILHYSFWLSIILQPNECFWKASVGKSYRYKFIFFFILNLFFYSCQKKTKKEEKESTVVTRNKKFFLQLLVSLPLLICSILFCSTNFNMSMIHFYTSCQVVPSIIPFDSMWKIEQEKTKARASATFSFLMTEFQRLQARCLLL